MKIIIFFLSIILTGIANAQSNEATLIIKHPQFNNEAGQVSVNDEKPILLDPVFGAGETVETIKKVKPGIVKIESSHWKREETSYINKFQVESGKTYTVVMYAMAIQIWDVLFSTMQDGLVKNIEPEKTIYSNWTVKNQVISIK